MLLTAPLGAQQAGTRPAGSSAAASQPAAAPARTTPPSPAVVRSSNAVVTVVAYRDGSSEVSTGVGVRVTDGRVITALRNLRGASRAEVFNADGDLIGTITTLEQGDAKLDLGVLRVTQGSDSVLLARRSATLKQVVHMLGPRKGTARTIAERSVTAVEPDDAGRALLRIGAPVTAGSVGSPVVSARGELVGVAVGTLTGREDGDIVVDVGTLRELLARPILRLQLPARDGTLAAARQPAGTPAAAAQPPARAGSDPAARPRSGPASVFPERYGPVVGADTARSWAVEAFGCSRSESRQKVYCFLRVTNLGNAATFAIAGADLTDGERRKLRGADNLLQGENVQRVAGWRRKAEIQLKELESVRVALEFAPPDKEGDPVRVMVDVSGERPLWFGPMVIQRAP